MEGKAVWIDNNQLFSRKSSKPLSIESIEDIRVLEHNKRSKMKRAALISLVFSFAFTIVHPGLGLAAFVTIYLLQYYWCKKFELRVTVFNNPDTGSVESCFHSSNQRATFDDIVANVKMAQANS